MERSAASGSAPGEVEADGGSALVVLEVHGWHTQCGACGYGRGGWASSPALDGKPILTPESRECHGCGKRFTHTHDVYSWVDPVPIPEATETGADL